jgi:hypothetical protein
VGMRMSRTTIGKCSRYQEHCAIHNTRKYVKIGQSWGHGQERGGVETAAAINGRLCAGPPIQWLPPLHL